MYESRSLCYVIGDARKLQMDGVLRSVPSEAAERLFAPSQGSTTSPPASTPDGRPLSTRAALVKEPVGSAVYLLDEDYSGRLVRRLVTPEMIEAYGFDRNRVRRQAVAHIPVGPIISDPGPHELSDAEARQYLENYPDVVRVLGPGADVARNHHRTYGRTEGRLFNPFVSTPAFETPPREPLSAVSFDGFDNFVAVADHTWFEGDFTIEGWVYLRNYNDWCRLLDFSNGEGRDNVILAFQERTGRLTLSVHPTQLVSSTEVPLNRWTHVAATLSGNTALLYINGVEVARRTDMPRPSAVVRKQNYLGRSAWNSDGYLNGLLAEVRVWGVSRTASEIQASMFARAQGNESKLLGCWPLDAMPGRMLKNLGSTRADGVFNGTSPLQLASSTPENERTNLIFGGQDGYVEVPEDRWFQGDFTVEAWVCLRARSHWCRVLDFSNGEGRDNIILAFKEGTGRLALAVHPTQLVSDAEVPLNRWTHVAATLSGNTAVLYINGIEVARRTDMPRPTAVVRTQNYLGRSAWNSDGYLNGLLAEVRIWDVARADHEIQDSSCRRLTGREAGLRACYPLGSKRDVVRDLGPSRFYGTTLRGMARKTLDARSGLAFVAERKTYVELPPDVWFDGDFTIEGWVRLRSYNHWCRVLDFSNGEGKDNIVLAFKERSGRLSLANHPKGASSVDVVSPTEVPLDRWTHVAATLSGNTAVLYINGVEVARRTDMPRPNAVVRGRNYLGHSAWGNDGYLDGLLADVSVWSVARSAAEIAADVAANPSPRTGREPYLRGAWPLDDERPNDLGPHGLHAVVAGGVSEFESLIVTRRLYVDPAPAIREDAVLSFDGRDDAVTVQHGGKLSANAFTLEARIRPRGIGGDVDNAGIVAKGGQTSPYALLLTRDGAVRVALNRDASVCDSSQRLSNDRWYHVAVTFDGAAVRIYIDGTLDATRATGAPTLLTSEEPLYIGVRQGASPAHFNGAIRDVRVWGGARTADEIAAKARVRTLGGEPGLLGAWALDEGRGPDARGVELAAPERTLFHDGNRILLWMDGTLRHVPNFEVWQALFAGGINTSTMTPRSAAPHIPEGRPLSERAELIRRPGLLAVYLVDGMGTHAVARHVASAEVFTALHFDWSKIKLKADIELIGPPVSIHARADGRIEGATWIRADQAVSAEARADAVARVQATVAAKFDKLESWMNGNWESLKNKRLLDLCLPGTHDSGTFNLSLIAAPDADGAPKMILESEALRVNLGEFVKSLAVTQKAQMDFGAQLRGGIRYFDLRVCEMAGTLYTCHSLRGIEISTLLTQIKDFLEKNTREVVLVKVGFKGAVRDGRARMEALMGTLSDWIRRPADDSGFRVGSTTLGKSLAEVVASGKRCIFIESDCMFDTYSESVCTNDGVFAGLQGLTGPIHLTGDDLSERIAEAQLIRPLPNPMGFIDAAVLTFGASAGGILGGLASFVPVIGGALGPVLGLGVGAYKVSLSLRSSRPPKDLLENAHNSRSIMRRYFEWLHDEGRKAPSVMICDFFDEVPYVEVAICRSVGADARALLPLFVEDPLSPSASTFADLVLGLVQAGPLAVAMGMKSAGVGCRAAGEWLDDNLPGVSGDVLGGALKGAGFAVGEVGAFTQTLVTDAPGVIGRGVETAAVAIKDGAVVASNTVAEGITTAAREVGGAFESFGKSVGDFLGL
jgi:hypothetical protein